MAATQASGERSWALSPAELVEIERVAEVSNRAFLLTARLLAAAVRDGENLWLGGERLTVGRLRADIGALFLRAGLQQPEGNLIAAGAEAAEPHHAGDDQRCIRTGEGVLVDLFPCSGSTLHPVFSDCSRTFCVGAETAETAGAERLRQAASDVVRVKEIVEQALTEQLQRTGRAWGFNLQRLACDAFRERGWQAQVSASGVVEKPIDGYIHGLGHGVGVELHQQPTFSAEFAEQPEGEIRIGQAITIEPGLYQSGEFGVRYEDLFLVEADVAGGEAASLRKLTELPWALDPKEFLALSARAPLSGA